jgi:hypothetical protein
MDRHGAVPRRRGGATPRAPPGHRPSGGLVTSFDVAVNVATSATGWLSTLMSLYHVIKLTREASSLWDRYRGRKATTSFVPPRPDQITEVTRATVHKELGSAPFIDPTAVTSTHPFYRLVDFQPGGIDLGHMNQLLAEARENKKDMGETPSLIARLQALFYSTTAVSAPFYRFSFRNASNRQTGQGSRAWTEDMKQGHAALLAQLSLDRDYALEMLEKAARDCFATSEGVGANALEKLWTESPSSQEVVRVLRSMELLPHDDGLEMWHVHATMATLMQKKADLFLNVLKRVVNQLGQHDADLPFEAATLLREWNVVPITRAVQTVLRHLAPLTVLLERTTRQTHVNIQRDKGAVNVYFSGLSWLKDPADQDWLKKTFSSGEYRSMLVQPVTHVLEEGGQRAEMETKMESMVSIRPPWTMHKRTTCVIPIRAEILLLSRPVGDVKMELDPAPWTLSSLVKKVDRYAEDARSAMPGAYFYTGIAAQAATAVGSAEWAATATGFVPMVVLASMALTSVGRRPTVKAKLDELFPPERRRTVEKAAQTLMDMLSLFTFVTTLKGVAFRPVGEEPRQQETQTSTGNETKTPPPPQPPPTPKGPHGPAGPREVSTEERATAVDFVEEFSGEVSLSHFTAVLQSKEPVSVNGTTMWGVRLPNRQRTLCVPLDSELLLPNNADKWARNVGRTLFDVPGGYETTTADWVPMGDPAVAATYTNASLAWRGTVLAASLGRPGPYLSERLSVKAQAHGPMNQIIPSTVVTLQDLSTTPSVETVQLLADQRVLEEMRIADQETLRRAAYATRVTATCAVLASTNPSVARDAAKVLSSARIQSLNTSYCVYRSNALVDLGLEQPHELEMAALNNTTTPVLAETVLQGLAELAQNRPTTALVPVYHAYHFGHSRAGMASYVRRLVTWGSKHPDQAVQSTALIVANQMGLKSKTADAHARLIVQGGLLSFSGFNATAEALALETIQETLKMPDAVFEAGLEPLPTWEDTFKGIGEKASEAAAYGYTFLYNPEGGKRTRAWTRAKLEAAEAFIYDKVGSFIPEPPSFLDLLSAATNKVIGSHQTTGSEDDATGQEQQAAP